MSASAEPWAVPLRPAQWLLVVFVGAFAGVAAAVLMLAAAVVCVLALAPVALWCLVDGLEGAWARR